MDPVSIALMFLKKWWKELLLVLVVVGAIWYVWNLHSTVESQKTTIINLETSNKVLKDSNETLTATIAANNKTIEALGVGATQTKEEFARLNGQVEQQTRQLMVKLQSILKAPPPATCEDTIDYLINSVPMFRTLKMSEELSQ